MARPTLTSKERRNHVIAFRLTDAERSEWEALALSAELSVSETARRLTFNRLPTVRVESIDLVDPALIKQLYFIGHNLNQLTRKRHLTGRVPHSVGRLAERIESVMDRALSRCK